MIARTRTPEVKGPTPRDLAELHERRLLRCRQEGRQVRHNGLKHFIADMHLHKGETEAVIYLEGSAEPVRPCEISIIKEPE